MAFEVRVDCPSCLVEGARLEIWDAERSSYAYGLPESTCCRLCGARAEVEMDASGVRALLVERAPSRRFASIAELEAVLAVWAREEGLTTASELLDAYFVLPTSKALFDALERGEPIETTFDVADYLFSGGVAGTTGGVEIAGREEWVNQDGARPSMPRSLRPIGGPRDELLAIAAVAAADGEASSDDLVVLARAADKRGLGPLGADEIRVWRPNEIPPPNTLLDRERVLEEMFQVGWSDGQMDESELRVIRDFARAWGIDPERLNQWTELYSLGDSNAVERWFRRIGLFLFPAR